MPKKPNHDAKRHQFGGHWTTQKLDVLAGYLKSYTTALKDKPSPQNPFQKAYIDAFAGSGYRGARRSKDDPNGPQSLLLPDLAADEPQDLLAGSAKRALQTDPPFDRYIFIDKSRVRCEHLEELKNEFQDLADIIDIQQGDANSKIQGFCREDWSSRRAVLFLDPYGMQVEWESVAAVAKTQAIDLWLLFPLVSCHA